MSKQNNLPAENEEYGNDFVTLVDENGKETEFEIVDSLVTENNEYFALIPTVTADNLSDDDGQLALIVEAFFDVGMALDKAAMADGLVDALGEIDGVEETISSWIISGRDQTQILKQLIDTKLLLLDAKRNLFEAEPAFKAQLAKLKDQLLTKNHSILVNGTTYHMNDPISYWEWSQLADADKEYFVETTYVAICDATISGTNFTKGDVEPSIVYGGDK